MIYSNVAEGILDLMKSSPHARLTFDDSHYTRNEICPAANPNGPNHLNPFCAHFDAKLFAPPSLRSLIHYIPIPQMTLSFLFVCFTMYYDCSDMSSAARERHKHNARATCIILMRFFVGLHLHILFAQQYTHRAVYTLETNSVYLSNVPFSNTRPCVSSRIGSNIIAKTQIQSRYSISVRFASLLLLRFS